MIVACAWGLLGITILVLVAIDGGQRLGRDYVSLEDATARRAEARAAYRRTAAGSSEPTNPDGNGSRSRSCQPAGRMACSERPSGEQTDWRYGATT